MKQALTYRKKLVATVFLIFPILLGWHALNNGGDVYELIWIELYLLTLLGAIAVLEFVLSPRLASKPGTRANDYVVVTQNVLVTLIPLVLLFPGSGFVQDGAEKGAILLLYFAGATVAVGAGVKHARGK